MPLHVLHPGHPGLFPDTRLALADPPGLLAVGGDLRPERLLAGYRHGIFPWYSDGEPILWWTPPERCVLHAEAFHLARRFARWLRGCDWEIRVDQDFAAVVAGCAAPRLRQSGTWISPAMQAAYQRLHVAGHAHSIEVCADGELIGGLYGVSIAGAFFAESMYSTRPQASKVALLALCRQWQDWHFRLIDVQLETPHLLSLGANCLPRLDFETELQQALALPDPPQPWAAHWQRRHARLLA